MLATNTGSSQAGTDKPDLIIYEREVVVGLSISQHHEEKRPEPFFNKCTPK